MNNELMGEQIEWKAFQTWATKHPAIPAGVSWGSEIVQSHWSAWQAGQAELAALRKDAERYRWLQANGLFAQSQGYDTQIGGSDPTGEEPLRMVIVSGINTSSVCDAIDAAKMKEAK